MAKSGVKVNKDTTKLSALINGGVVSRAGKVVQKMAQDTEGYAKAHMSSQSPSAEGDFPGVVTGSLVNSIVAEPSGDDWVVHDGVEYGVHLEYGTENEDESQKMAARPWLMPSVEYATQNLPPELLKGVVED